jgi:hypothetical protein
VLLSCREFSTLAAGIKHLYFILLDVIENTNGEPLQNSALSRSAECNHHVAEVLRLKKQVQSFKYITE